MNKMESVCLKLGINPEKEISKLFMNEICPEDKKLIDKFLMDVGRRKEFINLLMEKEFLQSDLSNLSVVEIGGGVCSTGAAFADKCSAVISLELEKVHCLYAKECKEHFNIDNLGIFYGCLTNVKNNEIYTIKDNSTDLVISHMGMFKYTVVETLEKINRILNRNGRLICVYPRFWTDLSNLNDIDRRLLNRAIVKNNNWEGFKKEIKDKLMKLRLKTEYNGILDGYSTIPIGGDVILGSNIASSWEEYSQNPIEDIVFGKTLISCNTLICSK